MSEELDIIQEPHSRHPERDIPVVDHRLLAGRLTEYNWMKDVPAVTTISEIVEVRFKNTRKAFFTNPEGLMLKEGDIVAVEAALGHDIGVVCLTGELVKEQMRLKRIDTERNPLKRIYRKAKPHDIEKWQQAIALEHDTMIRSRKIAADLNLNMKIGDVEYQGDKTKAIFYYIADERVDFRTLIKVLADAFHIRIEMKQIGARQEAGRIGGIGPCGRALCCSKFITNFVSVSTSAARYQDISLNPQKLAGQCGKLKCCLNYEVDAYIDAQKDFPSANVQLNVGDGLLYHQKTDIFKGIMFYTSDKEGRGAMVEIPVYRVKEIIALNRKGVIPEKAVEEGATERVMTYSDGIGEDSLSRFDDNNKRSKKKKNQKGRRDRTDRERGERDDEQKSEMQRENRSEQKPEPKSEPRADRRGEEVKVTQKQESEPVAQVAETADREERGERADRQDRSERTGNRPRRNKTFRRAEPRKDEGTEPVNVASEQSQEPQQQEQADGQPKFQRRRHWSNRQRRFNKPNNNNSNSNEQ